MYMYRQGAKDSASMAGDALSYLRLLPSTIYSRLPRFGLDNLKTPTGEKPGTAGILFVSHHGIISRRLMLVSTIHMRSRARKQLQSIASNPALLCTLFVAGNIEQ